jgi:hypothetical protein
MRSLTLILPAMHNCPFEERRNPNRNKCGREHACDLLLTCVACCRSKYLNPFAPQLLELVSVGNQIVIQPDARILGRDLEHLVARRVLGPRIVGVVGVLPKVLFERCKQRDRLNNVCGGEREYRVLQIQSDQSDLPFLICESERIFGLAASAVSANEQSTRTASASARLRERIVCFACCL